MNPIPVIAIVDDDHGVRMSLSSLLRSLGYAVRTYDSATAFLADRNTADPDGLITDLQMPQMDGEALLVALQTAERGFPIIMMTAFPTPAIRDRVLALGACAFLEKPVDADAIDGCLAVALAARPS